MGGEFSVGGWQVHPDVGMIRRGEESVSLEPRVMDLLCYLARHSEKVLSKELLIQAIWPDTFVADDVLTSAIWKLRQALGDEPRNPTYIKKIPRRGYQLVAEVHCLNKLLAKKPDQSAHEVRTDLARLAEEPARLQDGNPGWMTSRPISAWTPIASIIILSVSLGILSIVWYQRDLLTGPSSVVRTSIVLPEGESLASGGLDDARFLLHRHALAVSPDGRWIAYTSYRPGAGEKPDGEPVINLRRLDRTSTRRVSGVGPFFSPDSRHLGFVGTDRNRFQLKRMSVDGGAIEVLTEWEYGTAPLGCAWLPDGRIVFAPRVRGGLWVVSESGGDPRILTQVSGEDGAFAHRFPSVLPDGRTILYSEFVGSSKLDWSRVRIIGQNLHTGERAVLIEGGSDGRYAASGHLLFAREGRLMAVRFDPEKLDILGEPSPVLDGIVAALVDDGSKGRWAEAILRDAAPVSPYLLPVEVTNILRRAELAGDHSKEIASLAYNDFLDLRVELFSYDLQAKRTQ